MELYIPVIIIRTKGISAAFSEVRLVVLGTCTSTRNQNDNHRNGDAVKSNDLERVALSAGLGVKRMSCR